MINYNPHLNESGADQSEDRLQVDAPAIEQPTAQDNIVWQTRSHTPTVYEQALAQALETLFKKGVEDIEDIVAGLNRMPMLTESGEQWTKALFLSEIKRLAG